MTHPSRWAIAILALGLIVPAIHAQTPPAPGDPPLGRAHVWIKLGRADFDDDAASEWGVDQEGYLGLEGYGGGAGGFYFGGELSHASAGSATSAEGTSIRDFDFVSLELNGKKVLDLKHGLTIDLGGGGALFYADGEEVEMSNGEEISSPLADVGYGAQAFIDLNWRMRRLLVGLDVKYQAAFDILAIDYSNLRAGGHLGMAF